MNNVETRKWLTSDELADKFALHQIGLRNGGQTVYQYYYKNRSLFDNNIDVKKHPDNGKIFFSNRGCAKIIQYILGYEKDSSKLKSEQISKAIYNNTLIYEPQVKQLENAQLQLLSTEKFNDLPIDCYKKGQEFFVYKKSNWRSIRV